MVLSVLLHSYRWQLINSCVWRYIHTLLSVSFKVVHLIFQSFLVQIILEQTFVALLNASLCSKVMGYKLI